MKINPISTYINKQNIQNDRKQNNNFNLNFLGTPRVDKSMLRFYDVNEKRFPTTVKLYLESIKDKFVLTPLEAQKQAFADLVKAKSIDDVQNLFPEEELFIYLNPLENTKATSGLLGIYREFKEIYKDGVLTNGENFVVYLLKKLFIESKTKKEINDDLDKDLISDIKDLFKHRYKDNDYIKSSTLRALGIYTPDVSYQNSLKFTREGYSDTFGLKISQALLKKWNSYSDEEKFKILSKRCEGRDNWWNSFSRDEKLELVAGIDSENELYKNYQKYLKDNRKKLITEEAVSEYERTVSPKRIRVGSNIKDIDLFVLWMKKNLEKFYSNLSQEEKDAIQIKRSKKLAQKWQEMTPEERTEYINNIRISIEPLRYAMIDAWNHSRVLIRALSDFLTEKYKLKPADLIYTSAEFSEFQSRIMTEFWAAHRDLAEDFGKQIKYAHQKVEDAIKAGQFESLKKEIERERAERIKIIENSFKTNTEIKEKTIEKIIEQPKTEKADLINEKDFLSLFKSYFNKYNVLPQSYIREFGEIIFNNFPKKAVVELNQAMKNKGKLPDDVMNNLIAEEDNKKEFLIRMKRIQRAIEGAIAMELYDKSGNPEYFKMLAPQLTNILEEKAKDIKLAKNLKPNLKRIDMLYNDFKCDVGSDIGNTILAEYFNVKSSEEEYMLTLQELADYLDTYGKSTKILFSNKSYYTDEAKFAFSQKFIQLMPKKLKDKVDTAIKDMSDIKKERELSKLKLQLVKRLNFIPQDVVNEYARTVCSIVRFNRINGSKFDLNMARDLTQRAHLNKPYNFIRINKRYVSAEGKLKLLAIEQALEDELYRITKNPVAFSWEFEEAVSQWEMLSGINPKDGGVPIYNEDKTNIFYVKEKPNAKKLTTRYFKYYNEIKDLANNIKMPEDKIDTDVLLSSLASTDKNPEREKNIKKRIQNYF